MRNGYSGHFILLTFACLSLTKSFGQTDIFSNTVPGSLVTCGAPDTVSVTIYTVNAESNVSLEADLTANFEYVSILPNPNVTIRDTSDKTLPSFTFSSNTAGDLDTVYFLIKSNCASTTAPVSFSFYNKSNQPLGSSVISPFDNCTVGDSLVYMQTSLPGTVVDFTSGLDDVSTLNVIIDTEDGEMNQSTCMFDLKIGCRLNASIPQIFSPNGDGLNDVLYVYGRNFLDFRSIVFNRWGEKVFETNNPSRGWNETYRGKPALEGVYVYYFFSKTDQLGDIVRKGDVTLVR